MINQSFWWQCDKDNAHEAIHSLVGQLKTESQDRRDDNILFLKLYGAYEFDNNIPSLQFAKPRAVRTGVGFNICYSMVDTSINKLGKMRPYPTFLTSGADYRLRKKAKDLNKFCRGAFYATDVYNEGRRTLRDGMNFGTGFLQIWREEKEIKCERAFPDEFDIDYAEASSGKPRQLHRSRYMNKEVLKSLFKHKYDDEIDMAGTGPSVSVSSGQILKDLVYVIESWHLPSGKGAKDGRHTITISNCTLLDEEWKKDYFPFVVFHWSEPQVGFWGQGLVEQLTGIQYEINKLLMTIQKSHHLVAVPRIFYEAGQKFNPKTFTNEAGMFVAYQGGTRPPEVKVFASVHPEIYNWLQVLFSKAYEIQGISQMAAQAKKAPGLDAAVAIREMNDLESERFITVAQRIENFYLEAAKQFIELAREIAEEYGDYEVTNVGKSSIEKINWKSINLKEDEYVMQCFPTSSLPNRPEGRLQRLKEMVESGLVPLEEARALLDLPDLEHVTNRLNANINLVEKTIDNILYKELVDENGNSIDEEKVWEDDVLTEEEILGQLYLPPEPYQNLQLAIGIFQDSYLQARVDGVPEGRLDLMRRWMDQAVTMLEVAGPQEEMALDNPEMAVSSAPPVAG